MYKRQVDLDAERAAVDPLLRAASALVRSRPASVTLHGAADRATARVRKLATGDPDAVRAVDLDAERAAVGPLLRKASALVRKPYRGADFARRDLAGKNLRDADLAGADLRGSLLIGADLREADLREADLLGADLRGADLRGADLTRALFLTRTQVQSAVGDGATRIPDRFPRPPHWSSDREEVEQQ